MGSLYSKVTPVSSNNQSNKESNNQIINPETKVSSFKLVAGIASSISRRTTLSSVQELNFLLCHLHSQNRLSLNMTYLDTYRQHMPAWSLRASPMIGPSMVTDIKDCWSYVMIVSGSKTTFLKYLVENLLPENKNMTLVKTIQRVLLRLQSLNLFKTCNSDIAFSKTLEELGIDLANICLDFSSDITKISKVIQAFIKTFEEIAGPAFWNPKIETSAVAVCSFGFYLMLPTLLQNNKNIAEEEVRRVQAAGHTPVFHYY